MQEDEQIKSPIAENDEYKTPKEYREGSLN